MAKNKIKNSSATESGRRYSDVVYRYRPEKVTGYIQGDAQFTFITANKILLTISILTPDIFRLHYTMAGDTYEDFSYAIDPGFTPQGTEIRFEEKGSYYQISTPSLICRVTKKELLVHFYDTSGKVLCEDKRGFYRRDSLMKGISEIRVTKKAPKGVQYYGLGDKPFELNLRGRAFENWNTDSFAYKRGDDPLYRSIPFYSALIENRAYGIFFDNTYRTHFDFDRKKNETSSFSAEGGRMDYYFINGPGLLEVAQRYAKLTGTPEMPPMWALGYHQCRWSYYPESRVREIAEIFRERKIPCDAIYLDIDYMDNYKIFTWNSDYFSNPTKLINDLKENGFHVVLMVDPGIKVDNNYPVFEEGKEKKYFCTRPDGDLMIGPVWPPRCVFPDFTNPEVREWWGDLYADFMRGVKVSGIWNDMNEPAVFEVAGKTFPGQVRHDFDGHPCSHKKAHNIYGMQMARASLQGVKKHVPGKRPFLLTRANYSGGQRYAAVWTGDNIATWDHLRLANEQCLRLSISGYSFCGSDIGGFAKQPGPELYMRWLQLGVFHPLYRTHSMGYHIDGAAAVKEERIEQRKMEETLDQDPWSFGEKATGIARKTIELRYRLLNYLYTSFWDYVHHGIPVIKPLVYYDQSDPDASKYKDEFIFGDHILVSPVLKKGQTRKKTYLPKGNWYYFWDDEQLDGKKTYEMDAPPDQIPFFVKAGSVLPMRELMQYTHQKQPETLTLLVYHGSETTKSFLYEDSEQGYDYRDGIYRKTGFLYDVEKANRHIQLTASREGSYRPPYQKVEIIFIGLPFEAAGCRVDGKKHEINPVKRNGKTAFRVITTPNFENIVIS